MICTTPRGGARTGALLAPQLKVLSEAGFTTPLHFLNFLKPFQTLPQVIQPVTSSRGKKNQWCHEKRKEPWLHQVVCSSYLVCYRSSWWPISNLHPIFVKNLPYLYPVRKATSQTRRAHQDINVGFPHWPGVNLFHKSILLPKLPKYLLQKILPTCQEEIVEWDLPLDQRAGSTTAKGEQPGKWTSRESRYVTWLWREIISQNLIRRWMPMVCPSSPTKFLKEASPS